jgi:predicted DNA repair protein MutK
MATGLIALLDDVAAIAKVAAASVDDVAAQAIKAGSKAAGVVIDDAAVTPRYVVGFTAERELSIIWRIALGSLRNKLLILLPAALLLSAFAPWAITPLLMLGGVYLCYEGAEKLIHLFQPHDEEHRTEEAVAALTSEELERQKVSGAIRTDFILSAEIMAIALATIETDSIWTEAIVLAFTGIVITIGVYGVVALIVKADDMGAALVKRGRTPLGRGLGRALVHGTPPFLKLLSLIGTFAMLWVGGQILLHGLHEFGWHAPEDILHDLAHSVAAVTGPLERVVDWLIFALGSAVVGFAVGVVVVLVMVLVRPKSAAAAH